MKEMVGGCCVCSDERGWPENPLVYCDGSGCTVAVHQACYGIVTVPTGPWFCRKCESQERAARVRCELCPSRDGALKKTDNMGWAHVVCALYIPEVRFGNVTTMEPIILQLIPPERYNKCKYTTMCVYDRDQQGVICFHSHSNVDLLQLVIFVLKWEREIGQVLVRVCNAINRDANNNFTSLAPNSLGSYARRLATIWIT